METAPNLYCYTVTRSQDGRAPASWFYWCVARYVAQPRKDGTLTWRRAEDLTEGFRSEAKAIRESGVDPRRLVRVRQNDRVAL